jgi:hypothetical protein
MEEGALNWQNQVLPAAWEFARKCADLGKSNPNEPVLDFFMNTLMTELWDNGFSQSEIRTAFENAIADMPRYAAGEENRGVKL